MIRLDKWLADRGGYSRSEAKALIRAGRVTVDGRPCRAGEEKYEPSARLCVDGEPLGEERPGPRILMLHKPLGVLSATEDRSQPTVLDLLPESLRRRAGLFPVGRLDKDTTGLLLLTDDGGLAHRLLSPRNHVPKLYRARVSQALDEGDIASFREGLTLRDGLRCLPAELRIPAPETDPCLGLVTVYEGKYHQVRRMFAARGKTVTALHRERIGALELDPSLPPGAWRPLRGGEAEKLFSAPES